MTTPPTAVCFDSSAAAVRSGSPLSTRLFISVTSAALQISQPLSQSLLMASALVAGRGTRPGFDVVVQ